VGVVLVINRTDFVNPAIALTSHMADRSNQANARGREEGRKGGREGGRVGKLLVQ